MTPERPRKCIVLNEWLFHDVLGENGPEHQRETIDFLELILNSSSMRIAFLRPSPWARKAISLWSSTAPLIRKASKLIYWGILHDSSKCHILDDVDVKPLSKSAQEHLPDEDHYLIQTYLASDAELLVTTDGKLISAIAQLASPTIQAQHRDDFLRDVLSEGSGL